MRKSFRRPKILIWIILMMVFPASSLAYAQDGCYSLSLVVEGGKGEAPSVLTEADCPGGGFRTNTVVALRAQPAAASSVYAWRGADDALSTALTNTVTMTGDKVVGIRYIQDDDPNRPVGPGKAGGFARVDAPTDPLRIIPYVVIGTDDRIQVTDTTTPTYRKNAHLTLFYDDGDLFKDDQCTGWFVGPHTLITAGHCLYNPDFFPGSHWVIDISVAPARSGNIPPDDWPYGHAHASDGGSWQSVSGWVDHQWDDYDYGVIQLGTDELGSQVGWYRYGYFSDDFLSGLTATIAGYPVEKPLGTMWVDSDPITGLTSNLLQYTIDTSPGTSGSAVWYPSDFEVALAVHTRGDPPLFNHGTRITKGVAENFQVWGAATAPLTDCPAVGVPENISPAPGSILPPPTTLAFSWTAAAHNNGYQFQLWDAALSSLLVDELVTSPAYAAALSEGTYYWRVMAYSDAAGCPDGEWSDFWQITLEHEDAPPSVELTMPNGGESWQVGSVHNITWTAEDDLGVTNIALYYSTDHGSTWVPIDENEVDDGSYAWTLPDSPSTTALVKVLAMDAAANIAEDTSDANFNITPASIEMKKTFRSNGTYDGWVLESSEGSSSGGSLNRTSLYVNVGDDAGDKQYRSILSFNTAILPENASITRVVLKLKLDSIAGTSPFATHGGLKVDLGKPLFGTASLQISDFQAGAGTLSAATMRPTSSDGWYTAVFKSTAFPYISKTGITQLRLRFVYGDDDDLRSDFLRFFSGNAYTSYRPMLVIAYSVP